MGIKAVFFDMGGTLEKVWYTPELRLQAVPEMKTMLRSAGVDLGLNDKEFYQLVSTNYGRYHQWAIDTMNELSPERVWSEFILSGHCFDIDRLTSSAEELMFLLESRFFQREFRPEVPAALKGLRGMGLKIGLISNVCCRGLVPANLKQYGIRNYFDPIVLSGEYGRRKPDPAIFHYAARLANVPTGECIYVGDRIARDIDGACRAGFSAAIQIINDFDHGELDDGPEPDLIINRMDEMLDFVRAKMGNTGCKPACQSGVRGLLFDAGDILYFRPHRDRKLREFLDGLGLSDMPIPVEKKMELREQAFHGEISQEEYRQALLGLYGISNPVLMERGLQAMDDDDNDVEVFKGVPETLMALKETGFLLGIITDTANPIHTKLGWFERAGFGNVWDSFISSMELGFKKPDPRIYQAALTQLGLSVDQVVFVGHSPDELDGAREIKMKTIAFNYEESVQADYYIDKFEDLLHVPILSVEDPEELGI
jgi:putative hydrolase of the HAD superfamily